MLIANIGFIRFITNSRPVMNSKMHYKCRNIEKPYLRSDIYRLKVPDDKVKWEVAWPEYAPQDFTSLAAIDKPWADSNDFKNGKFKWNDVDELINRLSYMGKYNLDKTGRPLNPIGRTGLRGRGVLGRWGPNHAADPIVSRFHYGRLQFVGISRRDSGEWAIPGGMVDAGEDVRETLKREFMEEALGGKKYPELDMFWRKGVELYRGYVDDPRNTDNAWIETVAVNFHDSDGCLNNVTLKAGDDAIKLRWITVSMGEKLYASHEEFINLLAQHHSGLVIFIVADQSSIVMLSAIYRYIVTLCIVDVAGCGSVLWGLLPLL
ncbi:putative nudix hydrolase [Dirofilaria immitis]